MILVFQWESGLLVGMMLKRRKKETSKWIFLLHASEMSTSSLQNAKVSHFIHSWFHLIAKLLLFLQECVSECLFYLSKVTRPSTLEVPPLPVRSCTSCLLLQGDSDVRRRRLRLLLLCLQLQRTRRPGARLRTSGGIADLAASFISRTLFHI